VVALGVGTSSTWAQTSPTTQPPPTGPTANDRWWDNPPVVRESSGTKVTLKAVGGGLAGLGGLALLGASIAWLVSLGEASVLDEECFDNICYEDSRGGQALVRARDARTAAGITAGIGFPVMVSGFVVMLFGAGMTEESASVRVTPTVAADGSGLSLEARF